MSLDQKMFFGADLVNAFPLGPNCGLTPLKFHPIYYENKSCRHRLFVFVCGPARRASGSAGQFQLSQRAGYQQLVWPLGSAQRCGFVPRTPRISRRQCNSTAVQQCSAAERQQQRGQPVRDDREAGQERRVECLPEHPVADDVLDVVAQVCDHLG